MVDKRILALQAVKEAYRIRIRKEFKIIYPLCIFDLIQEYYDIELRFLELISLEGMYSNYPVPLILVNSERPPGRQAFTCAHELAHHVFNHGVKISQIEPENLNYWNKTYFDSSEFMADCFAGELLMPKPAVNFGFKSRGWKTYNPNPVQIYIVAGWLGVSYGALVHHMSSMHRFINMEMKTDFLKIQPKTIKSEILGENYSGNLIFIDQYWIGRSIDVQVEDLIIVPEGTIFEGKCTRQKKSIEAGILYEGVKPGLGRFFNNNSKWSTYVRVSRKNFSGRNEFRFLEEVENV